MFHKSLIACKSSPDLKLDSNDNEMCKNSPKLYRNLSNEHLNSPPVVNPHKALIDLYWKFSGNKSTPNLSQSAFKKKKLKNLEDIYNYCSKENTFTVKITKSNHLLGLTISGGRDATLKDPFCQLIRVWNLHPSQPALECGKLALGDVILEVNGTSMLGLTYNEALEVLRNVSDDVELKIFRPRKCCTSSAFPPLKKNACFSSRCSSNAATSTVCCPQNVSFATETGVFEVTLVKRDGCLGFSIIHEDNTTIADEGIYVKALTREHAISDGRIQPADRILQVNGTDVSTFSHYEALTCLRNAPEIVTLKLRRYRDGKSCCRKNPVPKVYTFSVIIEKYRNANLGFCVWDSIDGSPDTPMNVLPCAAEVKVVYPGGLADKNGIKSGDRILEINGECLLGKTADEANYILRKTNGVIRMIFCRLQQDQEDTF